jgi:hypothetical protein
VLTDAQQRQAYDTAASGRQWRRSKRPSHSRGLIFRRRRKGGWRRHSPSCLPTCSRTPCVRPSPRRAAPTLPSARRCRFSTPRWAAARRCRSRGWIGVRVAWATAGCRGRRRCVRRAEARGRGGGRADTWCLPGPARPATARAT